MRRQRPIVAIDGPAASGKSTTGRKLAGELDYLYIDTGALYRSVALKAMKEGLTLDDGQALEEMISQTSLQPKRTGDGMRIFLDGRDVTEKIKGEKVGFAASTVSAQPEVRKALLRLQRDLGLKGGIIMDGRDIGTVIFPDAEVKFFLDATPEERGRRRYLEMTAAGQPADLKEIIEDIKRRDLQDRGREHAPLMRAPGAIYIDTTSLSPEEVISLMKEKMAAIAP